MNTNTTSEIISIINIIKEAWYLLPHNKHRDKPIRFSEAFILRVFNPSLSIVTILYPLKTSENLWYKNITLGSNNYLS